MEPTLSSMPPQRSSFFRSRMGVPVVFSAGIFLLLFGIVAYSLFVQEKPKQSETIPEEQKVTTGKSEEGTTPLAGKSTNTLSPGPSPQTFIPPAGDVLEVEKTVFTSLRTPEGNHEDIEITVQEPKNNYTVAVYNDTSIVWTSVINKDDPGTHFHAFDIRPLVDSNGGSVLMYPEGMVIERGTLGKPPGFVYEIPIKLALGT